MHINSEEYLNITKAIKYYISKLINKNGFANEINICDMHIDKTSDNFYQFTYEINLDKKLSTDIYFLSGTISKKYVKLLAKRSLSVNKDEKTVSFTTIKIGQFVLDNNDIKYSDLFATIDRCGSDEKMESVSHKQRYDFKYGTADLLNNYQNLVAIKWPIIDHNSHGLVKKL